MGDTVQEYEIITLNDIVQLDSRQRIQFMKDLAAWLEYQDKINVLSSTFGVEIESRGMVWRDDSVTGATGLSVNGVLIFDNYA